LEWKTRPSALLTSRCGSLKSAVYDLEANSLAYSCIIHNIRVQRPGQNCRMGEMGRGCTRTHTRASAVGYWSRNVIYKVETDCEIKQVGGGIKVEYKYLKAQSFASGRRKSGTLHNWSMCVDGVECRGTYMRHYPASGGPSCCLTLARDEHHPNYSLAAQNCSRPNRLSNRAFNLRPTRAFAVTDLWISLRSALKRSKSAKFEHVNRKLKLFYFLHIVFYWCFNFYSTNFFIQYLKLTLV